MDANDLLRFVRDIPDFPQPGVLFKDITPLIGDGTAFAAAIDALAEPFSGTAGGPFTKVAGIEARGFLFAGPLALRAGRGLIPVRKHGKLPSATHAQTYALEYGTAEIEIHRDAVEPGDRVLVVDDVLATGGTAAATVELLRRAGADVVGVGVLLELTALGGRGRLPDVDVHAVLTV